MKENIVYILGAGFSAPLGIPLMGNFYEKSKDIYFSDPQEYEYFNSVFKNFKELSVIKNYYETDLFNIEEILSILEMQKHIGESDVQNLKKYICDVIQYSTPDIPKRNLPANWNDFLFGNSMWNKYGYFLLGMLNARVEKIKKGNDYTEFQVSALDKSEKNYSIITLNYDLVLENLMNYIRLHYNYKEDFKFIDKYKNNASWEIPFAKLQSVKSENIIPPTWNKSEADDQIIANWELAFNILKDANHVRILGYSLPESDSYFKYLLLSSCINNDHLKTIEVLCLDNYGDVKNRYDNFIKFKNYEFYNIDIENYLGRVFKKNKGQLTYENQMVKCNRLESAHSEFLSTA